MISMQQIIRENASTIVTQFMTVGGQALEKLQTCLYSCLHLQVEMQRPVAQHP